MPLKLKTGEIIPFDLEWNGVKSCPDFIIIEGMSFGDAARIQECNCTWHRMMRIKGANISTDGKYFYSPPSDDEKSFKNLLEECSSTSLPEGLEVTPELFVSLCKCETHHTLRSEIEEFLRILREETAVI